MSRAAKAVENFLEGFACSQAVLAEYCEIFKLDREQATKLAAGFAGGMRLGSTCGTVTAAYMILGLKCAGDQAEKPEGRKPVYTATAAFVERFEAENGSLSCKGLLGCDISTVEGLAMAKEKNLFKSVCPRFVRSAAEILDDMLENG